MFNNITNTTNEILYFCAIVTKTIFYLRIISYGENGVNINEIAKMAGVSRTTVSRVFHGGYVSEDAKKRIEKVLEETGYVPNARAQALRMKHNHLLGVLVPGFDSDQVRHMLEKTLENTEQKGYQSIVMCYGGLTEHLIFQIRMLKSRGADGLVLFLTTFDRTISEELNNRYVPSVTIGPSSFEDIAGIVHDDAAGFGMLAELALQEGYRKIGTLFPPAFETMTTIRKDAIADVLKKNDVVIPEKWDISSEWKGLGHWTYSDIFAEKILALDQLPEVFIAGSDRFAFRAIDAMQNKGIRVPEDIAVAGFGNTEIGQFMTPQLTTIDSNPALLVEKALSLLFRQIEKDEKLCEHEMVAPLLIRRKSL